MQIVIKLMKKQRVFFPLFLTPLLFFLVSCGGDSQEDASLSYPVEEFRSANTIILTVEESSYYTNDFENYIRSIVGSAKEDLTEDSLSRIFDKFVDEKILLQASRNQGLFHTSEEERDHLTRLRSQFWHEDRDLDDFDTQIIFDKLLIEKDTSLLVKDIGIDEEDIKEYYTLHKKDFLKPERVMVSQILVKTEDTAVEILGKLKGAPEEEFRKIAQQESIGPEASRGGEIGWFEMGQLPQEMESVIFSLKEG